MEHPFIIRVFEDFKEDGNICIAQELAQSDLFDIVKRMPYESMNTE
jgi:hypothetical protein